MKQVETQLILGDCREELNEDLVDLFFYIRDTLRERKGIGSA